MIAQHVGGLRTGVVRPPTAGQPGDIIQSELDQVPGTPGAPTRIPAAEIADPRAARRSSAPREAHTTADIVIVTHQSIGDLQSSFPSIVRTARRLGLRVIVADNVSTDGSAEYCAGHRDADVEVVAMDGNRGYAAAVNAAAERSRAEFLVVLNPDVSCSRPEDMLALLQHLRRHPEAAIAAPRLVWPNGRPQPSARVVPNLNMLSATQTRWGSAGPGRRAMDRYLAFPEARDGFAAVEWVVGAALVIRRRDFDRVGGWDPRFFLYFEDVDFCTRLWQMGAEVHYVPPVTLVHAYRHSSGRENGTLLRSRSRRAHVRSAARFFAKHPEYALRRAPRETAAG